MPETIINKFDLNSNFWKLNPQFKTIEPFKTFYSNDKSKSKRNSSTIMWGVAFIKDPDSILYKIPEDERIKIVKEDYLEKPDLNIADYRQFLNRFEELTTTQAERSLQKFYKKLQERDNFIESTPYSLDPPREGSASTIASILDKMMDSTHSLYKTYEKIKEDIEKEKDHKEVGKGGSQPSMSDSGEI